MDSKTIQIENLNVSYLNFGSGKPIVMLHGWGQSSGCFLDIADELAKNNELFIIDLPGFGDSDQPDRVFDIYDYEFIVAKFIEKLNLKNVSLIGHSFGGRISIIYAASTNNVDKLILTGAAGIKPKRSFKYYFSVYHYKYMKFLTKTPLYFQYRDDLLAGSGSSDYKNATPVMKQVLSKVVNQDLTHLLSEITANTLLYWGINDESTPVNDGELMATFIKKSKLVVKENSGHYAFLENRDDFISEVKKILK